VAIVPPASKSISVVSLQSATELCGADHPNLPKSPEFTLGSFLSDYYPECRVNGRIFASLDPSISGENDISCSLARIVHESATTTADKDVLPGVLGSSILRRTIKVRLGYEILRLPSGTPIFTVSRRRFMKYPGLIQTVCNGHGGGNMTGYWLHKRLVVLVLILLVAACAGPSVKRTEVDETIDLSGKWNDTDSRLVAEEMILDCLERPWLQRYEASHSGKTPAVIVGTVKN
jgi:hypothetical protein